jgi:flagellar basal-body rod modification protein FlgD
MTTVNNNTAATSTNSTATSTSKVSKTASLGKDEFLKLLITQMSHQDPLNPTDQTQQLAQLAQFTSLEQMQNMNVSTRTAQAVNMINHSISWSDDKGENHLGTVASVKIKDGQPQLEVQENYKTADLNKVVGQDIYAITPALDSNGKAIVDKDGNVQTQSLTGIIKQVKGTDIKPLFVVAVDAFDAQGNYTTKEVTIDPSDSTRITNVRIAQTIDMDKITSIL